MITFCLLTFISYQRNQVLYKNLFTTKVLSKIKSTKEYCCFVQTMVEIFAQINLQDFTSADHGIERQFTNSYNPAQNSVSKCHNRTLAEYAQSMLKATKLHNFMLKLFI